MVVTTMLLPQDRYQEYETWLSRQSADTLKNYFGVLASQGFIKNLVSRILQTPDRHYFLVASDHNDRWVGVLHMATHGESDVEFGIIVDPAYRGQGIADRLMDESVTWVQNRGYRRLYLHCLSWNQPVKHLCQKYGLEVQHYQGSGEVDVPLPPPSVISVGKEFVTVNRNIWTRLLSANWIPAK